MRLKNKKIYILTTLVVLAVVLLLPTPAHAVWEGLITHVLGPIFIWIIDFLGGLLIAVIQILIGVCQYNDFINSPAVTKGWVVLRDLCNMFFVIILLVIAFATVLGSEKYSYKKYLLPLVLMAILINFSKMIAGFFIDISQVAMLQFVNGFKYAAAGNFTTAFGLNEMLAMRGDAGTAGALGDLSSEVLISLMLAVAMLVTALVVTGVILVVFLLRIVALWILVMLSPVAFLASATPGGEKYSGMWWDNFGKYIIAGPVLAFFLWISLSIMAINPTNLSSTTNIVPHTENIQDVGLGSEKVAEFAAVGISKVGSSDRILSFIISIALLIGSLVATQKLGVAGASLAGAAKGKLESWGKRAAKVGLGVGAVGIGGFGVGAAVLGAKPALKGAKALPGYLASHLKGATGIELRPGKIKEGIKTSFERRKIQRELKGTAKAGRRFEEGGIKGRIGGFLGAPGWADRYLTGFFGVKGIKSFFTPDVGKVRKTEEQIAEEQNSVKTNEDQLKTRAEEVKQKRLQGTEAGFTHQEIDDVLRAEGLTPGTEEADRFMKKWDMDKARKELPDVVTQIDSSKERIGALEKDLSKYRARIPRDYYARQAWRQAQAEEMRKIDTNDEDELIDLFESALEQRDEFLVAALSTKIAQVGGLNSLVNKYEKDSNVKGLDGFTNEILINRLGMTEQTAYSLESDLSNAAANIAHQDSFGKAILVEGGRYRQAQPDERLEQQYRGYIEMSKQGREATARQRNRSWYGYEDPTASPDDNFRFNPKGLLWLRDNWSIWEKESRKGGRLNPNAAQNALKPTAFVSLEALANEFEGQEKTDYEAFLVQLQEYAKAIKSEEETQADLERISRIARGA